MILPPWWLELANKEADGYGVVELGVALAKVVGRFRPWDHGTVSRFLRNKNTTAELAEAFALLFDLPQAFYEARSAAEAADLQRTARRHESPTDMSEQQQRRLAALDQLRDVEEKAATDQTKGVGSRDERAGRGRRVGRTTRGRSSTT